MNGFALRIECLRGDLLVGGYTAVPDGLDAIHARNAAGRPLLPSTAVRGALRETLEALLRGVGEPACSGGDGVDPETGGAQPTGRCSLDAGQPCGACRLFGTQERAPAAAAARPGLVLADAILDGDVGWHVRHGVAISRRQRAAEENLLFDGLLPALRGSTFVAEGRLADVAGLSKLFEAAVRGTTHIGSGRSRGLARVNMAVEWRESSEQPVCDGAPSSDFVRIRVTLASPASIGTPSAGEWYRDTRLEIPGAALRGAVGFALAEQPGNHDDALFQQLVAEAGASFGFLYPVDGDGTTPAAPWPLTARTCKFHPVEHGVVDTLLDRMAAALATTPAQAGAVEATSVVTCARCSGPLRACPGTRRSARTPAVRQVTRVALDRRTSSAKDSALFTHVLLEAGATFEGSIENVPAGTHPLLLQALRAPLSVGRGRSMGWGRIRVQVLPDMHVAPLADRLARFHAALGARLRAAGIDQHAAHAVVPVTLMSPLVLPDGDVDGTQALAAALDCPVKWVTRARRFAHDGGWDQRAGRMTPARVAVAGSVYVATVPEQIARDALVGALSGLERRGAGERRAQGFGRVLCCDPSFVHGRKNDA